VLTEKGGEQCKLVNCPQAKDAVAAIEAASVPELVQSEPAEDEQDEVEEESSVVVPDEQDEAEEEIQDAEVEKEAEPNFPPIPDAALADATGQQSSASSQEDQEPVASEPTGVLPAPSQETPTKASPKQLAKKPRTKTPTFNLAQRPAGRLMSKGAGAASGVVRHPEQASSTDSLSRLAQPIRPAQAPAPPKTRWTGQTISQEQSKETIQRLSKVHRKPRDKTDSAHPAREPHKQKFCGSKTHGFGSSASPRHYVRQQSLRCSLPGRGCVAVSWQTYI
jgi:hypothetical protein